MGSDALRELDQIVEETHLAQGVDGLSYTTLEKAIKEAYELGKSHRRNKKEPDDNPYHIDYERQTKLEL